MRRFTAYRHRPPAVYLEDGTANPPDEPQYEGVIFSDGTVCVRWLTAYPSHSIWHSLQDLMAVHGHPEYGTRIEWHDQPSAAVRATASELAWPGFIPDRMCR